MKNLLIFYVKLDEYKKIHFSDTDIEEKKEKECLKAELNLANKKNNDYELIIKNIKCLVDIMQKLL